MSESRDNEDLAAERPRSPSDGSLLDLVRAAEEEATVAATAKTPGFGRASAGRLASDRPLVPRDDEFVEVGEEAVEAPPSTPPLRVDAPPAELSPRPPSRRAAVASHPSPRASATSSALPPAIGILLLFALAIGVLAIVAR